MKKIAIAVVLAGLLAPLSADQVIPDDLVVQGSLCTGFDCANNENFGFDTIRLKENNLRIKFEDTSATGSFPSNDWQITANDSASGGMNKFSIDDITGGRTPFTIEAGAKSNSLYVDDYGRVGFGTSIPVTQLHSVNNNTPTLRLEQDGSGGWTPQSWDIAGNEANFFIRDVTNGSRLPFRIQPGAPTNALTLRSDGKVGIGTWSPDASLHVIGQMLVSDTDSNTAPESPLHIKLSTGIDWTKMLTLTANGKPYIRMESIAESKSYHIAMDGTRFAIADTASTGGRIWLQSDSSVIMGSKAVQAFYLSSSGDLTIAGTLYDASDINLKENIEQEDTATILSKLNDLPLYKWNYKDNPDSTKHFGAMAQDFYSSFKLGKDDKHISVKDVAFLAIAGVQELNKQLKQKDETIEPTFRTPFQHFNFPLR